MELLILTVALLVIFGGTGLIVIFILYQIGNAGSTKSKPPQASKISKKPFSISYSRDTGRTPKKGGRPARWYAYEQAVRVQKYDIPGGLIYVGELLLDTHGYDNDACLINPKLKISPAEPDQAGEEVTHSPR